MAYDYYSEWFHGALARQLRPRGHCRITITHGNSQYIVPERQIKRVNLKTTGDPLSRRLPTETMEFDLIDYDNLWNPDNPNGYSGWFDAVCEVSVQFGLEKDNGTVEFGWPYVYYIQKPPSWKKHLAMFRAAKRLALMTMPFRSFAGVTENLDRLYCHILSDAGISRSYDYSSTFAEFPVNTAQSLPEMSVANALLQMAVACGGVVRSTEEYAPFFGVEIPYLDITTNPIVIRQFDMLEMPQSETQALIHAEKITRYDKAAEQNPRETVLEYEESFPDTAERVMYFTFTKPVSPASASITITGATETSRKYSRTGLKMGLIPDSTATPVYVKVEARPLTLSVSDADILIDANGTEDETLDCPLINSSTVDRVAEYRGEYLKNTRRSYEISYRGDPSIDVYNVVRIELPFVGVVPCVVLETDFTFDGAFHGRLFVRVKEDVEYDSMSAICGIATVGDALCGYNGV